VTTTVLAKPMVPAALQTAGFTAVGGRIYPINATAADIPVVLPAAAPQGVVLTFTRADISTHSVSIAASGSETILKGTGSFSSVVLNGGQGHTMTFVSNGGGAWRLAAEVPGIATYQPALPAVGNFTYSGGNVTQDPEGHTYTYNTDGTVATEVFNGVTRTYNWTAGVLTSVS
jgi:hypothetical protein